MSHSIPLAEGEMLESFIFHSLTAIPQQHDLELKQRVIVLTSLLEFVQIVNSNLDSRHFPHISTRRIGRMASLYRWTVCGKMCRKSLKNTPTAGRLVDTRGHQGGDFVISPHQRRYLACD